MVAAGLMLPIDIQTAFSASDEVAARAELPSPEHYPERGDPDGACQPVRIDCMDVDLARLLAWHAGIRAQESLPDCVDCAILAPR
jgi:hypothetical protein